jgi:hypothetical protein
MTRRRLALRIVVTSAVSIAAVVAVATVIPVDSRSIERALFVLVTAAYLLVGLLLIERRPRDPIGPIVFAMGLLTWFYVLADVYITRSGLRGADVMAWAVSLLDAPLFVLVSMVFLFFPDGHLPSTRWRPLLVVDIALLAVVMSGTATAPGVFLFYPQFQNPFAVEGFPDVVWPAYIALLLSVAASALSLVGRWRGADAVARAQLKWVASSAVLIAAVMVSYGIVIGPGQYSAAFDAAVSFAIGFFPVAIGIAILRYRLFEIDRIVSRTIAYVVVTAILVTAYAGIILSLQGPIGSLTGGDTIPVAISTLVVAALFQPLRRRVQSLVDRRFDRARFDAERTTSAFADRLREDVDIESVTLDLRATVHGALRPERQGLWLRGVDAR